MVAGPLPMGWATAYGLGHGLSAPLWQSPEEGLLPLRPCTRVVRSPPAPEWYLVLQDVVRS